LKSVAAAAAAAATTTTRNQKHRPKRDNAHRQDIDTRIMLVYESGINYTTSIVTIRSIWQKLRPTFTFWKISTSNSQFLWRQLPTELRNF